MDCISFFFFSSRRRHTRCSRDWSSDVCSSDLVSAPPACGFSRSFQLTSRILTARPTPAPPRRARRSRTPAPSLPRTSGRRSEERRVGKSVDLGGRRIIKKKKKETAELNVYVYE